jgi:hypothetical protein
MKNEKHKIVINLRIVIIFLICMVIALQGLFAGDSLTGKQLSSIVSTTVKRNAYESHLDSWTKDIQLDSFVKVDQLSGNSNYYSLISSISETPFFRAHYLPNLKVARLGYKLPKSLLYANKLSWQWRVLTPPSGSDERIKGKNDSGAGIYLIFKTGAITYVIKYVFSTIVPVGTIIRKDPLYPLQQMYIVVINTWNSMEKEHWETVTVDICSDFKRLFGSSVCPDLQGIGILTDGDGTNSEVVADYKNFLLSGEKK